MAYISAIVAISNNTKTDRRMTTIGLVSTGGACGVMICPPIAEQMVERYGWRGAIMILGAVNTNLVVCGLLMRLKQVHSTYHQVNSSDLALHTKQTNTKFISLITRCTHTFIEPFKVVSKQPVFTSIMAARVFSAIAYSGWAIFLVPHAVNKGISPNKAALLSSIGGIAAIFGRLIPGPIVDSGIMTATQLSVLAQLANTVAYVCDYWSYNFWSLSLEALINGFNFGSDFVLIFPLCVEVLDIKDAIDGYGLCLIPGSLGAIFGGLLIGESFSLFFFQ